MDTATRNSGTQLMLISTDIFAFSRSPSKREERPPKRANRNASNRGSKARSQTPPSVSSSGASTLTSNQSQLLSDDIMEMLRGKPVQVCKFYSSVHI